MIQTSRNLWWGMLVAGVAAGAGVIGWLSLRPASLANHVYRIGWMISPPFQIRGNDGGPAGLSVDLVNEAARRRGLSLQWIFWPDSSESALRSKQVDLWPLITITPERLRYFHISEPYLEHEHCFLVRDDSRFTRIEDLAGGTIGVSNISIDAVQLRGLLPSAKPLAHTPMRAAIEDTCSGRTDAAFADKFTAISALLEIPSCGGHTMRWIGVPQIRSQLGVGSTFESLKAADAIREEIGTMAREGRLAVIFGRWGFMAGQDVNSVEALLDARRREARLVGATGLFACLFFFTCWQTVRLIRERNRTRQAEAALRESQVRYMQAQKLESIGRLAGGIAHDFNNLLTVIIGYSDIVFGKLAELDPLRSPVDQIRKAGERAAELTNQLLVFARKQVVQPRPVNLNSLVQESENMFRRLVGEDIEVTTRLGADVGLITADPGQIHQVLMNLVANARDAMPDGGRLAIETSVVKDAPVLQESAGPMVLLTVADSGHGMDEQTKERIFEPFFTTKGVGQGTGLGLATAYAIVQQSNGWIAVQSQPGKGTSFQIYFPPATGNESEYSHPVADSGMRRGTETVLVVEDQLEVRAFAVSALSAYGYRVLDVADGAQALALSSSHTGRIDVLLTDIVMPGLNGRELAERLKAARPKLAVLYTSGYPQDVIAHHGVVDRDVAYIPKPYTAGDLVARIREILTEAN